MKIQVLLLGGPHNGSLFTHKVIGPAPLDLVLAEGSQSLHTVQEKVPVSIYRREGVSESHGLVVGSYKFLRYSEKAVSLVDRWRE